MQSPMALAMEREMTEAVLVERHGVVAIITMNLPDKRDALGIDLVSGLVQTFSALQDEKREAAFTGK
jgi:enoyl-CoA hydratase/carnithine racemase